MSNTDLSNKTLISLDSQRRTPGTQLTGWHGRLWGMDLVPDSVGRDKSNGFAFRNANPSDGTAASGAAHRAKDDTVVRELAERAAADPDIADHPLVAGLLVELPQPGAPVPVGWLDRWLDAARAVLELLYAPHPDGVADRRAEALRGSR